MSSETQEAVGAKELGFAVYHGVNWADYTLYRPAYPESFFKRIYEYHAQQPGASWSTAHDVGAGHGIVSRSHAKKFERVVVSDPNEVSNNIARQLLTKEYGKSEADFKFVFLHEAAESSSLEAETVDLITACECMHWMDPVQAVNEFARQLKPGGTLVMTLYTPPVIRDNERAQSIWQDILNAHGEKATGPLSERAFQICSNAYDSIALPPTHWETIKRVYINASKGIATFQWGDHVDEDRVGSHEERVWVHGDPDWFIERGVDWLKKFISTYDLPHPGPEVQGLWDELERTMDCPEFRMEVPVVMVFATKKAHQDS
ncbi:S-adenosyl-L-methionine-dependent methyltransferase [Nemania sp. NC0429]|nr:S-adenosyl-L-methionine-dependent methyltransferase [Nemania sp. NC0429]